MKKSNYIVFDVETGGLSPEKNPITQYSAVVLEPYNLTEIDRYDVFIRPYNDLVIEEKVLEATMVKMSDIRKGISVEDFVNTVTEFWKENCVSVQAQGRLIPVGHNVTFDIGFISYALQYVNPKITFDKYHFPNIIDTMMLGKMLWNKTGEEKFTLGECCSRAAISLVDAHGSMNDVEATADLLRYYQRRMRNGDSSVVKVKNRKRGQEFFEFKCAADRKQS